MNTTFRALATSAVVLGLSACGNADKANLTGGDTVQAAPLSDVQKGIVIGMGFDAEELGPKKGGPECLALRLLLAKEKQAVHWSSAWSALEASKPYKKFLEDKETFNGAKCDFVVPEDKQVKACKVLLDDIHADWEAIFNSEEWSAVQAHESFVLWQNNVERAKSIDCYKR